MKPARCAVLLCLSALVGCSRTDPNAPPDIRLGRDQCAECGMLINEDRCSSAFLIDDAGRRDYLLFDDIACMLDIERSREADLRVIRRFVHDHSTRQWAPADSATFLRADPAKMPTPMGSGIVAFADPAAAQRAREQAGGTLFNYPALAAARKAWMEERHGKPRSAPP